MKHEKEDKGEIENERKMALVQLQEMFSNQLEPEVVSLILSECEFNVDEALEKLFTISSDVKCDAAKSLLSQESHNHHEDVTGIHSDEKSAVSSIATLNPTAPPIKSSQSLSNNENMSGLPNFPSLEVFGVGDLGAFSVYNDRPKVQNSWENGQHVEPSLAKHVQNDFKVNLTEMNSPKKTQSESQMSDTRESRYTFINVTSGDDPVMPSSKQFEHAIPMKQEDSNLSKKTDEKGNQLMVIDESTISFNSFVQNGSKRLIEPNETVKQDEIQPINDTDLQVFNQFVKQVSREGPERSDWTKHTKGDYPRNRASREHLSFENCNRQGGNILMMPGHAGAVSHGFPTRMDPRVPFGKLPPDISKQQPFNFSHFEGLMPFTEKQNVHPITWSPFFQQQGFKPADAMPIPFCTGVNFPRNKNVVSTSGIRTQIPQWRLQRPELRMPTYPRKKYPPQQRVDCSSHTNITPQNHGNYGAQDQTKFQYDKTLILMRGLPGSGKSTLACKLKGTHGVVLSSDDFFNQNGRYVFDASLLGEAHEWNQSRARRAIEGGMSPIVIDNTNTQAWEMKPYVSLGLKYDYHVEFKEPNTPWQWNVRELARRNQHEVGEATISRMLDRYQHKMSITTVMNSRKPDFSQPVRENNKDNERNIISDCSKTNKKEVTIVSDVELPKEQRLRQSRNRRKHQEETTGLPVEFPKVRNLDKDLVIESESDLGVCLKDDTESLLHVDESERKLSFYVANKSENESEDVSSDDVNKRSIPRPQRTATRMRKCRERLQSPVHEGTRDTTMKKDEINEKKSSFTSIDNEALQDTLSMHDDTSKSPGAMLAFKEIHLINKTQHPHIIESEQKVSTGCVKSSETDQQNSRLSGDFYSESSLLSDPSFQQEHRVPEIFGNEGYCKVGRDLVTLTSSANHKRAAGVIEMENSKLKSVKAWSQDRLSVTSGDQSPEHALSSNSEDNILKGSEMEDSSCDECLPTQSEIAPPLPQLLASLTNSKRTSQEQKQLNHKIPQSNFSKAQDVQKSNFETLSNSSTYDSAEMDKSSNSTSVEKSSLDYQASTVVEGSCLKGDEASTTNDSETYNFLKTCFPAVDTQVIKDMLARYGEEAVPKIVDSLLSLDTFQDKEEFEEPYNRSSQSPDQVCSQGKSEDSVLQHVQGNAPENSRSQFDSQANPVNTANIPLTGKVPTFSNLSSVDLTYNQNPDQTSSVKTSSLWQLGASVSNERNTMELGSMSDDSITLKPEGKNLFTASGNVGQALNLQKESANVEKMQNENIYSLSDSSLPSPSRPSNRREKSAESDPGRLNKSSSPAGVKGKVQWLDNLYLTLEPALALQLLEIFGSIHGLQSKGGIAEKYLTVKLDVKLAKTLYERWKETVQECQGVGDKGLDEQKEEIISSTKSKPLLQQIMEEERVAELSLKQQAESNGSSSTEGSVAAMLKRQKLYDLFPGVNRIALDELFKANRYELQPTVQTVKMSCNLQEEPRNVVASGPIPPPQNPQELPSVDLTDDVRKSTFEKNRALMESMLSSASSEEGSYQALDDPGYADYRAEASMHARQRDDCFKKAALAFSKKQGALAQIYAQQGHQHTQKLKEANWRAAKKILQSRNCNRDDNTIDLHGLHVSEALCALEELLLVKTDCDTKCVTVVTGRGSHSKGGKARIKPAVLDYLVRNNFRFEEINQGLLKVYL